LITINNGSYCKRDALDFPEMWRLRVGVRGGLYNITSVVY
jgi:hypothetical protein